MRTACSFLLYRPQPKTCVQALRPSRDNPRRPLAQGSKERALLRASSSLGAALRCRDDGHRPTITTARGGGLLFLPGLQRLLPCAFTQRCPLQPFDRPAAQPRTRQGLDSGGAQSLLFLASRRRYRYRYRRCAAAAPRGREQKTIPGSSSALQYYAFAFGP